MAKLKVEDLDKIKNNTRKMTNIREGAGRGKITVHMGTCGIASGAREIMSTLLDEIDKAGIDDIIIKTSGCAGFCSKEPMITVELKDNPPVKYGNLTPEKMREIFKKHIIGGDVLNDYILVVGSERMG